MRGFYDISTQHAIIITAAVEENSKMFFLVNRILYINIINIYLFVLFWKNDMN